MIPATLFGTNTFSPDGDGLNDRFTAIGQNVIKFSIYIYNRWGELVYTSDDIYEGWDGTYKGEKCQEGVYMWVIYFKGGRDVITEYHGGKLSGHVNLIR